MFKSDFKCIKCVEPNFGHIDRNFENVSGFEVKRIFNVLSEFLEKDSKLLEWRRFVVNLDEWKVIPGTGDW